MSGRVAGCGFCFKIGSCEGNAAGKLAAETKVGCEEPEIAGAGGDGVQPDGGGPKPGGGFDSVAFASPIAGLLLSRGKNEATGALEGEAGVSGAGSSGAGVGVRLGRTSGKRGDEARACNVESSSSTSSSSARGG